MNRGRDQAAEIAATGVTVDVGDAKKGATSDEAHWRAPRSKKLFRKDR